MVMNDDNPVNPVNLRVVVVDDNVVLRVMTYTGGHVCSAEITPERAFALAWDLLGAGLRHAYRRNHPGNP